MNHGKITYQSLNSLLSGLGFVESSVERRWRAYLHAESDTLIVLPFLEDSHTAREADLISIRRHLVDNHLADDAEISEYFDRRN